MSSKATRESVYEDFEPAFRWVRDESDTIILLLSGFRREEMKVQIASNHILKVSGEHKMEDKKSVRRRFYKEFSLPRDININQISAKFEDGKLYIKLPKTMMMTKPPSHKEEAAVSKAKQVSQKKKKKNREEEDEATKKWKWIGFIVALLMLVLVIGIGVRNNAMQDYSSSLGTSDVHELLFDV